VTQEDPDAVRSCLDELSWTLLDAALAAVDSPALQRAAKLTSPHLGSMSQEHRRMYAAIKRQLAS